MNTTLKTNNKIKLEINPWQIVFRIATMLCAIIIVVGVFLSWTSVLHIFWGIFYMIYTVLFEIPLAVWFGVFIHFLSFSAIVLASFVTILRNPIYSLLCLIGVFFHAIVFLLALKVEFLALILLIIYVGAIAILFLFVIMMFNLKELALASLKRVSIKKPTFWLTLGCFLPIVKFYFIIENYIVCHVIEKVFLSQTFAIKAFNLNYFINYKFNDIFIFSNLLYTYYSFLFILSSFILFVAMIGAIILALSTIEELGPKI